ncbi:hypothetical protein DUT91_20515 [Phyllobacterium salinisoli]|uniref:Uncharacterized protein n=1 Tax=Phyllobacterium salinisoli TaxID=1899321 RepID=A0A368JY72_9HYPH|nr:hypothetical protein DUT91_20515 [Phyllobacterium salinisoli]
MGPLGESLFCFLSMSIHRQIFTQQYEIGRYGRRQEEILVEHRMMAMIASKDGRRPPQPVQT